MTSRERSRFRACSCTSGAEFGFPSHTRTSSRRYDARLVGQPPALQGDSDGRHRHPRPRDVLLARACDDRSERRRRVLSRLFGWDVNEQPMGPTETYSMFKIRNRPVGAASTLRAEQRDHGVPPHWDSYVAVASADDAVTRAQGLGATVLAPPFDVMDAGRMAVLQDPTGATFMMWQAGKHQGAGCAQRAGRALLDGARDARHQDAPRSSTRSCSGGRRRSAVQERRWSIRSSSARDVRASA